MIKSIITPIEKIHDLLQIYKLDALLIISSENRLWLTNFSSTAGHLLLNKKREAFFFLDGRYITEYQQTNKYSSVDNNIQIIPAGEKIYEQLTNICRNKNIKLLGIEKEYTTLSQWEEIKKKLSSINIQAITINHLREIKNQQEEEKIRIACRITANIFEAVKKKLFSGMTEIEIENLLLKEARKNNIQKMSFDSIVVSGERTCLPHGKPTNRKIKEGELITIDFGCSYQGYLADMTRTISLGKPKNQELELIYNIVKEAQLRAIKKVKSGVEINLIDKTCREYIEKHNYGEYFVHGTGHGIGIQVHENPFINKNNNKILKTNMIITIEPGIYKPEVGGVRIEDDILVKEDGYEILTDNASRDLLVNPEKST